MAVLNKNNESPLDRAKQDLAHYLRGGASPHSTHIHTHVHVYAYVHRYAQRRVCVCVCVHSVCVV